ncbi:DUF883 family protein [Paracoccus albus]|uniref:DUF883 family protein n=1 Tax=Paracoccus albus TaxID=3017784 RepID=UPI0022F0C8EE|nr:DUF883 domain-containing protein [Paracoccus albus]WBU61358.1 DUF883 domain-containing protein [Paracoccus albus]
MSRNEYSAQNLKEDARHAAEDAAGKAQDTARQVKEKAGEYADTARELGHEYAEAAKDEARRLYRKGQEGAQQMAGYAEDYYDELSTAVRRNPAQALGIAVGVGFLVGLLIARR